MFNKQADADTGLINVNKFIKQFSCDWPGVWFLSVMPRPRSKSAKPYGRQKKGRTIKSVSLDDDVVKRAQEEADKRGMSFSELVNGILSGTIKLGLVLAFLALAAMHWHRSPKNWSPAAIQKTATAAWHKVSR